MAHAPRRMGAGAPSQSLSIWRINTLRPYYIDDSETRCCYLRTALDVDAKRWNELHRHVRDRRLDCGIATPSLPPESFAPATC